MMSSPNLHAVPFRAIHLRACRYVARKPDEVNDRKIF